MAHGGAARGLLPSWLMLGAPGSTVRGAGMRGRSSSNGTHDGERGLLSGCASTATSVGRSELSVSSGALWRAALPMLPRASIGSSSRPAAWTGASPGRPSSMIRVVPACRPAPADRRRRRACVSRVAALAHTSCAPRVRVSTPRYECIVRLTKGSRQAECRRRALGRRTAVFPGNSMAGPRPVGLAHASLWCRPTVAMYFANHVFEPVPPPPRRRRPARCGR